METEKVRHVLVAEDNMATANAIRFNLKKAGLKVTVARCGKSARKLLDQDDFDLVVTDFQMPGMTGGELCKQMAEDPRLADIPVILLTAKTHETDLTYELEVMSGMGMLPLRTIMSKPFSPRELVQKVRAYLRAEAGTA